MFQYLLVTYTLLAVAFATPLLVSECGTLGSSFTTYKLANDVVVNNANQDFVCFNIVGKGITLDGNGFKISSGSNSLLPATAVQFSGDSTTVTNLHITNFRTGINAQGKFGTVYNNVITHGTNGIDVSATNNRIMNNVISDFHATEESTSGIFVYFPAVVPVDSYVNISNNVIFNIRGDNFAQGISVYFANFVSIGQNQIYNIEGALLSQDISVIESSVDASSNVFTAPPSEGVLTSALSAVLAVALVLASFLLFRKTSSTLKKEEVKDMQELEDEKAEIMEKKRAEDEAHENEIDVPKKVMATISLSSSISLNSSGFLRSSTQ